MILFQNVTRRFGETVALEEINLYIEPGEFVVFTGESGAGKTTLARLLIKEVDTSEGVIQVGEFIYDSIRPREIPSLRRQISIIFQDFKLLPDRNVSENVALSLEIIGKPKKVIEATVAELLKVVDLSHKADSYPSQLSGGESQRVVIARALATEPAVIFADEPTGNLDQESGWQIMELLERINESGTTVLLATHNQEYVKQLKHRVINIKKGKVQHDSNPKIYKSEKTKNEEEPLVELEQEVKTDKEEEADKPKKKE